MHMGTAIYTHWRPENTPVQCPRETDTRWQTVRPSGATLLAPGLQEVASGNTFSGTKDLHTYDFNEYERERITHI